MLHGATTSPSACRQMTLCEEESRLDGGSRKAAVCQRVPVCCMRDRAGVCQIPRLHSLPRAMPPGRSELPSAVRGRSMSTGLDLDSSVNRSAEGRPVKYSELLLVREP